MVVGQDERFLLKKTIVLFVFLHALSMCCSNTGVWRCSPLGTWPRWFWSSGGVVVKCLACGARGPWLDSRSRRYEFRDWLSPASKSRYGWKIAKATQIFKTTNTHPAASSFLWMWYGELWYFRLVVIEITSPLTGIKGINQSDSQRWRLSESVWSCLKSASVVMVLYSRQSYANNLAFEATLDDRSVIYARNSSWPMTVNWCTPTGPYQYFATRKETPLPQELSATNTIA